jgi:hypothetical protein
VRAIVLISGIFNTLIALILLFAPTWFYEHVGDFPPFNRHYMGDAGAFLLAIGIGLLIAWRTPARHSTIILVGALSGLIHVVNHVYDDFIAAGQFEVNHFVMQTLPLLIAALLLLWAWTQTRGTRSAV